MKKKYDFSKGEKGNFYVPEDEIEIPVYLSETNRKYLTKLASEKKIGMSKLIKNILAKDKDLINMIVSK
jgi:hypothetical protein